MSSGMMPDGCGSSFILALPDDLFAVVTRSLSPRDVCNLALCCKSLHELVASEKIWLAQCEALGLISYWELIEWRKGICSFKALCRFLVDVKPLLGIWVHQNPELGNVVYVMPGFLSVIGCRIIPQELGPLGLEDGPILWAPVFETVCDFEGSSTFFLHGRERGNDYVYPGSLKAVDRTCNVLLLEVEPRQQGNGGKLFHSMSHAHLLDKESSRKLCRSDTSISKSQRMNGQIAPAVPFNRLAFGDRRKLLDTVTSQVRLEVPDAANLLLFPRVTSDEVQLRQDIAVLYERRVLLIQMHKIDGSLTDWRTGQEFPLVSSHFGLSEIRQNLDQGSGCHTFRAGVEIQTQCTKRKTFAGYVRESLKQILGKSNSMNRSHSFLKKNYSSSGNKHAQLHEFLRPGDSIALTLHASTMKLSSYRAWPNMHDSKFALYKLPVQTVAAGQEYAGLWGGTFGWPPGKPSEDKPGKALFLLLLSYEKSQGKKLIATKILEGTHYVLHPNGSAMFMVNVDEPSPDEFPWDSDGDSNPVDVKNAFIGEGIANGYGFRYPGSKPGSLYVIQDTLLAFVWKESRAVLTLQRLNLQELLKKGERVDALPPISNFAYLTRSYSNVFAGFSNAPNAPASPRYFSI
nr:F-box protein At5g39450 [Ipomoea batatas]